MAAAPSPNQIPLLLLPPAAAFGAFGRGGGAFFGSRAVANVRPYVWFVVRMKLFWVGIFDKTMELTVASLAPEGLATRIA